MFNVYWYDPGKKKRPGKEFKVFKAKQMEKAVSK